MSSETGSKLQPATAFTFSTHGPFLIPISRAGFKTALVKRRIQFSRRLIPIGQDPEQSHLAYNRKYESQWADRPA
jgi:hypothetical protein